MLFDRDRQSPQISLIAILCAALLQPANSLRAAQKSRPTHATEFKT